MRSDGADGVTSVDRNRERSSWSGLAYFYATSLIVAMGIMLGVGFIEPSPKKGHRFDYAGEAYANWDGQWYKKIAVDGYDYAPNSRSSVAFFPAYPLLSRGLARLAGLRPVVALLVVSNVCLALLFCLVGRYVRARYPDSPPHLADYVLLAMGLVPTSFFFRMAYSESLFLLLAVLTLYAMQRRWPPIVIAAVIGLASATRPVGVGLIPAFALHLWHRSATIGGFAARAAGLLPLACWGFGAYAAYLYAAFGDPLAFARTQAGWAHRPSPPLGEKLLALASLEPIRTLYDPSQSAYWGNSARAQDPLFSLRAADPVYFLGGIALVAIGAARRWLNGYELLTAATLLAIPYVTNGYEQHVQSIGRYASVAFPVYLVLGRLLSRAPAPMVAALAGVSGFLLGVYAALFAAWHVFL